MKIKTYNRIWGVIAFPLWFFIYGIMVALTDGFQDWKEEFWDNDKYRWHR